MNPLISHGQATRSTLAFSRVTHFISASLSPRGCGRGWPPASGTRTGRRTAVRRAPAPGGRRPPWTARAAGRRAQAPPWRHIAAVGRATPEGERQPQGQRGQGVGEVVQSVAQEGHRAAEQDHHQLQYARGGQGDKGDLQSPDAPSARLQGAVAPLDGVVVVRGEQRPNERTEPVARALQGAVRALIAVIVVVGVRHGSGSFLPCCRCNTQDRGSPSGTRPVSRERALAGRCTPRRLKSPGGNQYELVSGSETA